MWSSSTAPPAPSGNAAPAPTAPRGAPQPRPQRRVRARLARDRAAPCSATKSSRIERAHLAGVARRVGPGAAQPRGVEGRGRRRLLAVEEHEAQLGRARGRAAPLQRPRELHDRRRAARAVVGADEAREVLGVVVRGDDDRRPRAREPPDHVAQPDARARARSARAAARGAAARPAARRARRARRPRAELDLALELGPRAAESKRSTRAAGAGAGRAGAARRPRRRAPPRQHSARGRQRHAEPGDHRDARAQSLEVTASSSSANRSRASARRVGTCSLGTPSAGGA